MLRIMMPPGKGAPPAPPTGPPTDPNPSADPEATDVQPTDPTDPESDPDGDGDDDSGDGQKVPQANAGYQGPEQGPFECGACKFFVEPGSCMLVAGAIDEHACCNNFTSAHASSSAEDADQAPTPDQAVDDGGPDVPPNPSGQ